jgi:protein-L-isoaspartate(D-aspartate) O-methyltransferase
MKRIVFIGLLSFAFFCMAFPQSPHPAFSERQAERWKLVYEEIANYKGIHIYDSSVLEAMNVVPRHAFVPENMQAYAYRNRPLPIGYEQTISQPLIVASMTQLLEPAEDINILEIGTGSGYQATVLAEMGANVYSIEIVEELGNIAKNTLYDLGYTDIHLKIGDGYQGWAAHAPYDRIIVTCAPEDVPEPLITQLKPGGKIVIPLGPLDQIQYLVVLRKDKEGEMISETKYPVRFVPMTGEAQEE